MTDEATKDAVPGKDVADPAAKPDAKNPLTPAPAPKVERDEDAIAEARNPAPDPDVSLDYSIQR